MYSRRWNVKTISLVLGICLIAYAVLCNSYQKYKIENVIRNIKPENVWEYVSDFSKMRLLNPTILNFTIIADHGHLHDWRYSVKYTERLSHWPHWLNTATADFVITKTMPDVKPALYSIESVHKTCFFSGIYCLRTESIFKFTSVGADTRCEELIRYQCPPLLTSACRRELKYQREAVMHNLSHIFTKKK